MTERNRKKKRHLPTKAKTQEYRPVRVLRIKKDDDIKTIYAKVRASFTAADLQRYTEDEEMVPAKQVLKDLETVYREEMRKRKRKKA